MIELNIARTIIQKRKEKGLTQDELAYFFGISKASVSKWETGQSYPDILLLPQLAAFFNISIDDLVGYEPQMTDKDIRKLYKELALEFTTKPFDEVMSRCRGIAKKYYSCLPLLVQIGVLYINYGFYTVTSIDEEQKMVTVEEAKELFVRVKEQSNDVDLKTLALNLEATCQLILGNPGAVIDLLGDVVKPTSNEILLAQAYQMTGKITEAKTEIQRSMYNNLLELVGSTPHYLAICADDPKHYDEVCRRTTTLIELFNVKNLCSSVVLSFNIAAAQGYMAFENPDKALENLETYTDIATSNIFPLEILKGDDFFNLVAFPLEDLPFGIAEVPRDEESIKQSIIDGIANNPVFAPLHENLRYQNMVKRLKNKLHGGA